jgi:hypothetical protein
VSPEAARKTKNRQPASGGGQLITVKIFLFIFTLIEITSSETFISEKAPLRLRRSVAVSGFSEQLLMLAYYLIH